MQNSESAHSEHSCSSHFDASRSEGRSALKKALVITIIFMVVEFVGGWLANSLALMADAIHMLTDAGSILVSLFAFWIAQKPNTPSLTFGYRRAEILGALFNALAIWLLCGSLIYEAFERMSSPPEVRGSMVFGIGTIGLIVNGICIALLHSPQSHNLNVRSAYLHVLGDLLGSVATIIAGAVILYTDWWIVDPLVTIIFSGIILYSSWSMVKEATGILMEGVPTHIDPTALKKDLESIAGVEEIHDLHIWTITSGYPAVSVHVVSRDGDRVLSDAHEMLKSKHKIIHTTIQVEHPDKFESEHCYDCHCHD
ncbi:MAG: cobalt-zinc-cadmium efflux system protein [Chlamydiales bacterium]|jgi:cobalt-zinc-cadmium efflux system protein